MIFKETDSTAFRFQVARSLGRLESVTNFTEFVKAFSQFGAEMVELAHLTGDRQNDTKDERRRAQMQAARQVLERSTMMLLISSKVRAAISKSMIPGKSLRTGFFIRSRLVCDIRNVTLPEKTGTRFFVK